jgi:polyphosphate glucokinase
MTSRVALGIDIGGSGIKGAPVDLDRGVLLADRVKIETPAESTPQAVAEIVRQIATHFIDTLPADAPIGVTIPGVVQHGVVRTAANIDKAWLDCPGEALFSATLGRRCLLVNDADAAGVAEQRHGAAKGTSKGWSSSRRSAPASVSPCCTTACSSPTRNSATSSSTATTPRPAPRPALKRA